MMKTSVFTRIMLLCLVLTTAGAAPSPAQVKKPLKKEACCAVTASEKAQFSDKSLYQLDNAWTSQEGKSIKLSVFKGKIPVLAMVYTNCTYACPRIVADIKAIDEQIPETIKDKVVFVLVSMDPKRDTPEQLRDFARKMQLDERWTLLRSDAADVATLAALLGVKYKQEKGGEIAHSNIISLLNPEGEIVYQLEGLGQDQAGLVDMLKKLAGPM